MHTPITRTITVCQFTDYNRKITYCFQTAPSSTFKKAVFMQSVFLPLRTLFVRSLMRGLNEQVAWYKMKASSRMERVSQVILVHSWPHIGWLKCHIDSGSFIQLHKPQPSHYRRYSSRGQIRCWIADVAKVNYIKSTSITKSVDRTD